MNKFALIFLVLVSSIGVVAQSNDAYIPLDVKFSSDSEMVVPKGDSPELFSSGTKNGVRFKISHSKGRGSVESIRGAGLVLENLFTSNDFWHLFWGRASRPRTDVKTCWTVMERIAFITEIRGDDESLWLRVLPDYSPETLYGVDVDGSVILRERQIPLMGIKIPPEALQRLNSGKRVTIRTLAKDNDASGKPISFGLYGFAESIDLCKWVVRQIP